MNNVIGNRRNGKQIFYALNGQVDVSDDNSLEIDVEHYAVRIGARAKR
jgi:hypothetical protein